MKQLKAQEILVSTTLQTPPSGTRIRIKSRGALKSRGDSKVNQIIIKSPQGSGSLLTQQDQPEYLKTMEDTRPPTHSKKPPKLNPISLSHDKYKHKSGGASQTLENVNVKSFLKQNQQTAAKV